MDTRTRALIGLLLGSLCFFGCATTADLKRVRRDHMALQARVDAMRTKQTRLGLQMKAVSGKINRLNRILNQFQKRGRYNFANIGSKLDDLRTKHQELLGKFQLLRLAFDKLNKQITQPGAGSTTCQMLTPEATSQLAQRLYQGKKYDQAIMHLKTLVKNHPTHQLTDDAYMMVGDCYSAKGNSYEAIIWYNDVRKKFTTGNNVDHSLLKLGAAHYKIGACPEGRAFLRRMLRKFRQSTHTAKAREYLRDWRKLCKKR
jgi:TolA-binding protein